MEAKPEELTCTVYLSISTGAGHNLVKIEKRYLPKYGALSTRLEVQPALSRPFRLPRLGAEPLRFIVRLHKILPYRPALKHLDIGIGILDSGNAPVRVDMLVWLRIHSEEIEQFVS
jgi:hypothetical protein